MDRYLTHSLRALFWIFLGIILTSCATKHKKIQKKDGPPKIHVDVSKIPNAVPKAEPLARLGNMPSYKVFGVRYYTLQSSKNYKAKGTASWYGTQFHQRNTSSGEPYNMLSMTAAHKTLPLPTYVEVENLKNHRKVIVKVNDRGPFVSDRLIDLSYVAAKKLDMLGKGTAPVMIKAIDPYQFSRRMEFAKNKSFFKRKLFARKQDVYLQVGAFRNKVHAEQLRQRLIKQLSAPIKIATPSLRSRFYRVRVGPLKDVATADNMTEHLRNMGIESNQVK